MYMFMSCQQNAGQNYHLVVANKSFKHMAVFTYFAVTVTNKNCIHQRN